MHAHSDYTIKISGTEKELSAVADVLMSAFQEDIDNEPDKEDIIHTGIFEIEETYEVVFLEDIADMAADMAKAAKSTHFTIEGVIDTSESAGEYMDFKISYEDGKLTEQASDWYLYPEGDLEDMSYDEYLEEYEDFDTCSEDDFEKRQKGWFIVETSEGDVMMEEVPLKIIREEMIE